MSDAAWPMWRMRDMERVRISTLVNERVIRDQKGLSSEGNCRSIQDRTKDSRVTSK